MSRSDTALFQCKIVQRVRSRFQQTFNCDNRNQLTNASRSGTLTVAGQASLPASSLNNVTVSGTGLSSWAATVYADGSWARTNATLADGNNTYTATATELATLYGRTAQDTVMVNLPAAPTFQYDANGNLTGDGRRVFEYDFENQLTNVFVTNAWRSEFQYDAFGRRRVRKEYTWIGSWFLTKELRYVYDGMLVVQERDANNVVLVSYTRGTDLSGSLQGAGGIGGLLARSEPSNPQAPHAYYHCDGNGNVTAMVNTNGLVVARYHYDPYGNLLGMAGPLAEANVYRFSSKEWHASAGIYYYGFRYYEPNLQRWMNRDPLEELGGLNLYGFVANNPLMYTEPYGLHWTDYIPDWIDPAANFCAGAGDDLTLGLTDLVRESVGWNERIDKESTAYGAGETTAMAASMITPVGVGKAAAKKAVKEGLKRAAKERAKNIAKGIDPKDLGPSGRPKIHTKDHPTRKRAVDAALEEGKGPPIQHPSDIGQPPHFHPVDN